jgi:flagella basal body P-ring formation protein FlgA
MRPKMTSIMTFRQLRWFALPAWRRPRRFVATSACALLLAHAPAEAATLRGYAALMSPTVHLSDLFDNIGSATDKVLGPSPAPGDRITVEAPQLAAIARDYAVDWRPESGSERIILERAGERLAQASFMQQLRAALAEQGAPADANISVPTFDPPLLPAGAAPHPAISETSFDAVNGRFTALLSVSAAGMPTLTVHLSGQVVAMLDAVILTHHVRPGAVLHAEDLRSARVRTNLLRGNSPISINAALGQALRHDLPPGQPLTTGDVARPVLVARNSAVRMRLDAGEISLSAQGLALEDGGLGETVRVQNPSSKAIVLALVTAAGEVRVMAERAALEVAAQ